ncbi:ABC transporter ATP-binding protein [Nocardioides caldifontis]|uniref:ABC transporter ATP-binding protein n=1 Tax=Nocardioides caldifontis TaxID=2588938 RepID=UPI0011DF2B15|nr:ABC transporter ATP-binding protein [Nocardioides caldifontis]
MSTTDQETPLAVRGALLRFGGILALNDVNFDVEPGETFGIIGPNGAGKTALLNCVSGVYRLTEGNVDFFGERISGLPPHRISAKGLGRTFQNMEHFRRFKVLEYVMLGRMHEARASVFASVFAWPYMERLEREERSLAMELLEELGLAHLAQAKLSDLPYGVQKRVDIARALLGRPKVLLLDEPTSGTITQERTEVSRAIDMVSARGVPTVLVDHDVDFVSRHCARVLVLSYGKQVGVGSPAEMLARPDVIETFLGTPATS